MKHIAFLIAILILASVSAQNNNCSKFYASEEGKELIIHQFNKKERLSTITEFKVTDVENTANRSVITIAMHLKDGKNKKSIITSSFKAHCAGKTTRLDPESFIAPGILDQYNDMEYSITGDNIFFPNSLTIGQELPNASVHMSVNAGIMSINMTTNMLNRKVIAKERVTTPAGTFDCYVITYTNELTMGMTTTQQTKQWIAEGVGMVKEETRKTNGKLITKSILYQIN
ncbi:hypothetical protein ATO12_19410 [Aquimarina atlantica]|uniref:DUF3108 domain-containing protein n=1 Tax=Aquimarina atlantica TaxID=1317122 RepID=A0A023BTB0_9FLAO|nr:hypothetical protein [Aquimarina atlantica]EZH73174.1 hypothetical protein ATO12_19410 [Aquimarina atlantica]